MVKVHDGSLVPASELLSGAAEDDEGNKLEFKALKDVTIPTYECKTKVPDDTGRTRLYSFSLEDVPVTVHMTIQEPGAEGEGREKAAEAKAKAEEKQEAKATEKAFKETETKKNTTTNEPPLTADYRLKK